MNNNLNIALIQTDTVWKDIDQNLINLSQKLISIADDVDVIVLPELFSTGFTMDTRSVAETMDGKSVLWMKKQAAIKNCLLIGSLIIKEETHIYNRLIVAFPEGRIEYYDKRHLFSYAGEDEVFSKGDTRLIIDYKGFKIFTLICYDLRFPVWARNTEEYDIILFVANWPNARIKAWDTLLKARAMENLCYSVGVNRVGVDNNDLLYTGHSAVYDALGNTVLEFEEGKEGVKTITLHKDYIVKTRSKFRFLEDRDEFVIK